MAKKAKLSKKEWMQKIHGKNFKYGSMSTVIVAVVVVLTILLNVGASALVNRFPSLKLDMSEGSRLTLSQDMNDVVDTVSEKTEIIFCATRGGIENLYNNTMASYVGADAMNEGTRLVSLAEKAAERNENITVRYVDLDENPSFVKEFPNEDLNEGDVIVRTKYRYRVLTLADMYSSQINSTNTAYEYISIIEYTLANAMVATNLTDVPVITLATGHGETAPSVLATYLQENNFEINSIDLMTSAYIREETDVLIISNPTDDFSVAQIEMLDKFLENDGKYGKNVLIMLAPTREETPRLDAFMAEWGMQVGKPGEVVVESDENKYMQYAYVPLLNVSSATDAGVSNLAGTTIIGSQITSMKLAFEEHGGVAVYKVLTTNDTSYVIPAGQNMEYKPVDSDYGENVVLAHGEKFLSKDGKGLYSRVSVCTSIDALNTWVNQLSGNRNLALQYFKHLTGTVGEDHSVYIEGLKFTMTDMTVTQSQVNTIGLTIFTITIPVLVLLAGMIIWLRRRHL